MFYVFNMLLPCFLITLVALLGKVEYLQTRLQSLGLKGYSGFIFVDIHMLIVDSPMWY